VPPDDPDNPANWSAFKKAFIAFQIWYVIFPHQESGSFAKNCSVYSFAVYLGTSIYIGGVPEILEKFEVSIEASSLGLALYVLACIFKSLPLPDL
jgi:DHA1 family multidrug resistance protein-like MFS transporter